MSFLHVAGVTEKTCEFMNSRVYELKRSAVGRKFQRPPHPNTGRTDPFVGEDGSNPFAGENAEVRNANVYVAADSDSVREYQASDFETVLPHRGKLVFLLGAIGLVMSLVGAVGVMAVSGDNLGLGGGISLASLAPCSVYALVPAAIAWMFGRQDVRAIRVGAMSADGFLATNRGLVLGRSGTCLAVLACGFYVLQIILISWR